MNEMLTKLASESGGPFFFYDLNRLSSQLKNLQANQFDGLKIWYATKANPLSDIIRLVREAGFGIDVASMGELAHAQKQGFVGNNIIATGPAKSRNYLTTLLHNDVSTIVCESLNQLLWLNEIAGEMDRTVKVLLRVQLDWEEGSSVLGGNAVTPFGIEPDQWRSVHPDNFPHLDILGFHVFQWGNILDLQRLDDIWRQIARQLLMLGEEIGVSVQVLDLGGGLGIPYTETEQGLNFDDVSGLLWCLKTDFDIPEIWLELGRYLVGECGYYATEIIDRKTVRGKELLVTAGGINHIARPALTDQGFPCQNISQTGNTNREFQVHGPLCTALDQLGIYELQDSTEPGDWLVFSQAGAYGMTEAMPYFLCHDLPAEIISYQGKISHKRSIEKASSWLK